MKSVCPLIFMSLISLQCSGNLESKIDLSFDERAKFIKNTNTHVYSNKVNEYPGIIKSFSEEKKLIILTIFFSPKLKETIYVNDNKIGKLEYTGEKGSNLNKQFSYEEACEIVRENNWDMRESITLEDCYGFWGKYARRWGLIETKRGY